MVLLFFSVKESGTGSLFSILEVVIYFLRESGSQELDFFIFDIMFQPDFKLSKKLIRKYIGNEYDCWDVFQNAVLKYYSNNPDENRYPLAFFTIALRWAITDFFRDLTKRKLIELFNDDVHGVYPDYDSKELFNLIMLNANSATKMKYKGYTLKETSNILGCTISAVKGQRFKDLNNLKKKLNHEMFI